MSDNKIPSRRRMLGLSFAVGGLAISSAARTAFAQDLKPTPHQALGPFYPDLKPLDQDADLTLITGQSTRAQGQLLHLMGQVLNLKGEPIAGARVEIWQANTHGRYNHPGDGNPAPLDANFQGFAEQRTDAQGRYRFKTIKPGAYPAGPDWVRPPHIHFVVTHKKQRLVTQMYFPGEALNEKDFLLQDLRTSKDAAIARFLAPTKTFEADALVAVWDVVLDQA